MRSLFLAPIALLGVSAIAQAQIPVESGYQITVNSNLDEQQPDTALTLREAIALANGTLTYESLSPAEQALVRPSAAGGTQIGFDLPPGETTIALSELLPAVTAADVTIDGTTQAGYDPSVAPPAHVAVPTPIVSLTPAAGAEVFRGLMISGDRVTVRGLSIYGFSAASRATQTTPPADIFISNAPPPADASPLSPPVRFFDYEAELAPADVRIEQNWLGLPPTGEIPDQTSTFGVSVFNAVNPLIRQNRIEYHEGSGIITSVRAQGLQVTQNTILSNGLAGMPDAIRLEGEITDAAIVDNLLCGNDGSGIFMFKPTGAATIRDNIIQFNGRRFERAAVYVMGQAHQITDNFIGYQPGAGVAVTAFPLSDRNIIRNNRFAALDGLSIDLNYAHNVQVQDFQQGDGPNPPRNSRYRREDTGNAAINAPQFNASTFALVGDQVSLNGRADPGSEVDLYQVSAAGSYRPLAKLLTTVPVTEQGTFSAVVALPAGTAISAIATDPRYGTSEPSALATVAAADGSVPVLLSQPVNAPSCLPPVVQQPPLVEPPEPIRLRVPRNIHFALDRADISTASAEVLSRIAAVLLEYPFLTVEIQGHTDPRASVAYNQALSDRRAKSARDYLLRQGVAAERMRIVPLGESQRATTGSSRIDYARDRRVEFIFEDTRGLDIIFESQETDLQPE
ncbi:OmpA family protein [Almyronema epifaneia]|uniref:OmpA family protein n=1 Tax=Almyronema epifaneia S1 TaxID=2991925 RepID=A0ABW6IDD3_9CYAN